MAGEGRPTQTAGLDPVRHAPSIPVEYAPIPVGPNDSELVAHDRHRLNDALVRGIPVARTLRIDELPDDVATVARIEVGAIRRLRQAARAAQARRWRVYVAAAGLPFLTATLLGLLGVWLGTVPVIGEPVGAFVATAGGNVGGLPLAAIIAALPSVWWIRRVRRAARAAPQPNLRQESVATSELTVQDDLGPFLADAREMMRDIGGILSGNPRPGGEQAHRLAVRFGALARIAARHDVPSVVAFAADAGEQFRIASQPPARLIPGLRLRRRPASVVKILAPYMQRRTPRLQARASRLLGVASGLVVAAAAFFAAGVFGIRGDEALLLRTNEAIVFPSSGTVLALPHGFDGPAESGTSTLTVVQGPGFFWSWPRPITERRLVPLTNRALEISVPFPGDPPGQHLNVEFRYEIDDLKSFVATMESLDEIDSALARVVSDELARGFADRYETELATPNALPAPFIVAGLQEGAGELLSNFVEFTEVSDAFAAFGVTLRPEPSHSFSRD